MTTLVLIRAPRSIAYAQIVRAICRHLDVPVSTETRWDHGYGDIHIHIHNNNGHIHNDAIQYAAELYLLTTGIDYRILSEDDNAGETAQGHGPVQPETSVRLLQSTRHNSTSSDPPRRTA